MAQDDIQGTVTDSAGDPVEGAVVALIPNDGSDGDDVLYTTTDSNGDYIFDAHPQGDGTTQEWHVMARYDDGSGEFNTLSLPYVSADLPEGGTIPDSVVNRVPFSEGTGTTAAATVGNEDITLNNGGTWESNTAFESDTAPTFDQTDDGPATWSPRTSVPLTWTMRVRADANGLQEGSVVNEIYMHDQNPRLFYRTDNDEWELRDGAGSTIGTVSDGQSGLEGSIRILATRLDSSSMALDVYEEDATTKVGSASTSNPNTSFDGATQYLFAAQGGENEFGDVMDLVDVHDEYVSDIDTLVNDVYS